MALIRILTVPAVVAGIVAAAGAAELNVRIANAPATGVVAFVLFDSANSFGDLREPVREERMPLDGRASYRIDGLPPGEYALLVYLDENDNRRLDKNFIGIPREPLAFSNRYQPKGPPRYRRAAFVLEEADSRRFDVALRRPLGERGRVGVGMGAIMRSSPYRDYDGSVVVFIPALTYIGDRFQIYGPNLQFGLVGQGNLRLAATASYRIGDYEEDDSDFLEGMGDRDSTLMAGLALQAEMPGGIDLTAGYEHDVLDKIGGGAARLVLDKSIELGRVRCSPKIGMNWVSRELSQHDFGVPAESATAVRPAYSLSDTLSVEAGIGLLLDITPAWLVVLDTSVEWLDADVTDSPIVDTDYVIKSFAAINYVF